MLQVLKLITRLHIFANILCVCSGTSDFTDRKKKHTNKILYWNNCDTFLDLTKKLRWKLVEIKNNNLVKKAKRLLNFVSIMFFYKEQFIKYFKKLHCNIYKFLWLIFSTNKTGKGHEYQMFLPGIIYYNFVPSTKYEGKYREH